jgi:hypothetical protein
MEGGKKVTFHSFPKDEQNIAKWVVKIRRDVGPTFKITRYTKICSRHFRDNEFRVTYKGKKFIKDGVVPSVFPWTKGNERRPLNRGQLAEPVPEEVPDPSPSLNPMAMETEDTTDTSTDTRIAELEKQLDDEYKKNELLRKEKAEVHQLLLNKPKDERNRAFSLDMFKDSDSDICFYTGFPTYNTLTCCLYYLNPGENGENIHYV